MKDVTFVTGNGWRHDEAKRLLAGIEVKRARLSLAKPSGAVTLGDIASARVRDAFRQLGTPCFTENTGLYLSAHGDEPGPGFKRLFLELGEREFARRFGGGPGVTRVALAFTADGTTVELFEGQNSGTLLTEPRGEGGYGWDTLWVPDGYDRTLAELSTAKFLVNMRHLPFLELAARLRGPGLDGIFEAHVTVANDVDLAAFERTCAELGVKFIDIALPRGETVHQPMTGSHHRGEFKQVQAEVHELARTLVARGFRVVRTKIEAVGSHAAVPRTDDAAKTLPRSCYFEYHLKLGWPEGDDTVLTTKLEQAGALVSKNVRKPYERYVTMRLPFVGQATGDARFADLQALVHELGATVKNRVREYTVYDSAPEVDAGWWG